MDQVSQSIQDESQSIPLIPHKNNDHRTLVWAKEAFKPQPPIPWIVDQLFSAGSLSIVYGKGGTKKPTVFLTAQFV